MKDEKKEVRGEEFSLIPKRELNEHVSEAPNTPFQMPKQQPTKLRKGHTAPSVQNLEKFMLQNTVATTLTDFANGQDGQHIHVLGDGQTSVGAAATSIISNTGAAKLLAVNKVYGFTRFNGVWIEDGS